LAGQGKDINYKIQKMAVMFWIISKMQHARHLPREKPALL
jgi:hypothetical protein